MANIVAITGCTTGVAHTMMAAEALKRTAPLLGHDIKVEMQCPDGPQQTLSREQIGGADVVIIASDVYVDASRFGGKPTHVVPVCPAIRNTRAGIEEAVAVVKGTAPAPAPGAAATPTGAAHTA